MAQPYPQKEETHEREFASHMIILGVVGFVNGRTAILLTDTIFWFILAIWIFFTMGTSDGFDLSVIKKLAERWRCVTVLTHR